MYYKLFFFLKNNTFQQEIVYNIYMKKEVFIRLFKIEESNVLSIKLSNNDLILVTEVDIICFAMGNNIRENDYHPVQNNYIFKDISSISSNDLFRISNIYNSNYINELICFDTNLGKIYFDCSEVIVK